MSSAARTAPPFADLLWNLRQEAEPGDATLILLPHAGGTAQGYADWASWFPREVTLLAAQYPGRGVRFGEPPASGIDALAEPLARVLLDIAGPLYLFGHSLGAVLAFEVAARLERAGRNVGAVFASAASAPHRLQAPAPPLSSLADDELLAVLRERGGLPAEVLDHPDLLEIVLPVIRADFAALAAYEFGDEPRRLQCPIVAFGGDGDGAVPVPLLHAWNELSAAPVEVAVLTGGHFYINDHRAAVTGAIRARLAADEAERWVR